MCVFEFAFIPPRLPAGLELADFKTVQHFMDDLEEAGILRDVTGRKRNRLYRAGEVFDALQKPIP